MKFSVERQDKYAVVTLIDTSFSDELTPLLKAEFISLNADGFCNIILDMTTVATCADAQDLSSLLVADRLCKKANGLFVVCCVQQEIMNLMEISALDRSMTIVAKFDEATDLIFMAEIEKEIMGSFDEENE